MYKKHYHLTLIIFILTLYGCGNQNIKTPEMQVSANSAEQSDMIKCKLPSQIRKLGAAVTYLAPGRTVKTSTSDCKIRGGVYI